MVSESPQRDAKIQHACLNERVCHADLCAERIRRGGKDLTSAEYGSLKWEKKKSICHEAAPTSVCSSFVGEARRSGY